MVCDSKNSKKRAEVIKIQFCYFNLKTFRQIKASLKLLWYNLKIPFLKINTKKNSAWFFFLTIIKNSFSFKNKPWNFRKLFSLHAENYAFNPLVWIAHYDKYNNKEKQNKNPDLRNTPSLVRTSITDASIDSCILRVLS